MSVREEHDFLKDYLTWMKGAGLDQDSLQVYNFGYNRPLPFPSIALTPDTTIRLNFQTSGMQTPNRISIVVIGKKYLSELGEIMTVVERLHEDTAALPFAIFVDSVDDIETSDNISSHVTPCMVRIFYRAVVHPFDDCVQIFIDNSIQVHIPQSMFRKSYITKLRCQFTSNTTHDVLISKEIRFRSYREICGGEPKKVNLGYNTPPYIWNNRMDHYPPTYSSLYGEESSMAHDWEILLSFFSTHNIEANWFYCNDT